QHWVPHVGDWPVADHVLMDRPILVPSRSAAKQPQVPRRVETPVTYLLAEDEEHAVNVESAVLRLSLKSPRNLQSQLGGDPLVGVQNEDPLSCERDVLQRPVLLFCVI